MGKIKNGDIAESELTENLTSQPVEIDEQDILKFLSSIKIIKK